MPRKQKALPKNMGACVDLYYQTRQERLELQKQVDLIKAEEQRIKDHIIDNVSKAKDGGAVGKTHKAIVVRKEAVRISDDTKFYAYVKKYGAFDLLNRAINKSAFNARLEAGKKVPGVETFQIVDLSVTKI